MTEVKSPRPVSSCLSGTRVFVSALQNVRSHTLHSVNLFDELTFPTAFSEHSWIEPLAQIRAYYRKNMSGGNYLKKHAEFYRSMKAQIPAILPAGEFFARRDDALLRPSGFMQFDIDAKDNPGRDLDDVKWLLAEMEEVAYVGKSVSGIGIWGLVRISRPSDFSRQARRLLRHLNHHTQVCFDEPVTMRKSGLRLLSYDERAWVNPNAKPFTLIEEPKQVAFSSKRPRQSRDRDLIELLLEKVEAQSIDITTERSDWVRIMFALSTAFGTDGVQYAQRVSQFYPGYDAAEVERVYLGIEVSRRHPVPMREIVRIAEKHWQ